MFATVLREPRVGGWGAAARPAFKDDHGGVV